MKKIFNSIYSLGLPLSLPLGLTLSLGLGLSLSLASCSDVPAPYEVNISDVTGGDDDYIFTGDGTQTNPYSVTDIKTLLDAGSLTSTTYAFVQGRVSQFDSISLSYGNAYYNISTDGLASGTQLIVYRGYYTGSSKFTADSLALVEGDSVVIYGCYQLYSSKYEINQGSKIAYLNGKTYDVGAAANTVTGTPKGSGTLADPYNPSKAISVISTLANKVASDTVYVQGIVSKISSIDTGIYGNAEYYLSEDGQTTGDQLLVYRGYGIGGAKFTSASDLQVGDTLVIRGQLINYNNTYEVTTGSRIVTRNGSSAAPVQVVSLEAGSGTLASPYNTPRALALIASGKATTDSVYVAGRVTGNPSVTFGADGLGTYTLILNGIDSTRFTIAGGLSLGGTPFADSEDIMSGDSVIVYGVLDATSGLLSSRIVYLNGETAGVITPATPAPTGEYVSFDFASNVFGLSTTKATAAASYTYDGYTITLTGSSDACYYYNSSSKYLIIGKSGATLTFSALSFPVAKIEVTGRSAASANTKMNLYVGETAVSTQTTGCQGTNTYEVAAAYQAAGNAYTLKVDNAYNAQITEIKIYKAE